MMLKIKILQNNEFFFPSAVFLFIALYTCFDDVTAYTASVNDSRRLVNDFINQYDRRLRPVINQTQPIDVYFTFHLLSLLEIDEVQQRMHINAWVNFSWWDEVRTWNPQDYNGIDVLHPDPLDIWRPRTIVANSIGPRDIFGDEYAPFSILSTGSTTWSPGAIFYLSCQLDLTYFPFDTQTCAARILTNDLATEINVIPTSPFVLARGYTPHGEWDLESSSVTKSIIVFGGRSYYVRTIVSLVYKRRPTYYLLNVLSPVMVLSFLSLLGFIVPKESGERVSFAITVLLSLAVFMGVISGQLPPSSDTIPVISIYIFSLLCLSGFSVFIIVSQLRLATFFSEIDNEKPEPDIDALQEGSGNRYIKYDKQNNRNNKNYLPSKTNGGFTTDYSTNLHVHIQETVSDDASNSSVIHGEMPISNNDIDISTTSLDKNREHGKNHLDTLHAASLSVSSDRPFVSKFNTLCKKLVFRYDDLILFFVFTIAWVVFTTLFFNKVLNQN